MSSITFKRLIHRYTWCWTGYSTVLQFASYVANLFGLRKLALSLHFDILRNASDDCNPQRIEDLQSTVRKTLSPIYGESIARNFYLKTFLRSPTAVRFQSRYAQFAANDRIRLRQPREDNDFARQGNLMVLKPFNPKTGELGVLILKYNNAIEAFPAVFDVSRVVRDYAIVLEPSHWGLQRDWLPNYLGNDATVVLMAQYPPDYTFIRSLGSNIIPIEIGPSDWTDPEVFKTVDASKIEFDVVMIGSWSRVKRHEVLFAALSRLNLLQPDRDFKLALVGKPADLTLIHIRRLAAKHRVLDRCTFFENIPPSKVAKVLNSSSVHVLTSLYEGSPKVLTESLFSNVPVIVNQRLRGLHPRFVNSQTGLFATDSNMAERILEVIEHRGFYAPREWALKNSGYVYATRELNKVLMNAMKAKNLLWTTDIIPKRNAPHLRYVDDVITPETEAEFERLQHYLR